MNSPKLIANGVTIDLNDYMCMVNPKWIEPKILHESILTGKKSITTPNGLTAGYGRYSVEIIIWNTDGYLSNIEQDSEVDFYPFEDEGINFNCIVELYKPFHSGSKTLRLNSALIRLTSSDYVANPLRPETPAALPTGYTFHTAPIFVTLSCGTSGVSIYYTTDGTEPAKPNGIETTALKYLVPISISVTTTLKARAYVDAMDERFSFDMTEVYTFDPV